MNIVHLIFSLEAGGSENLLVDLANGQAGQNKVSIIIVNNKVDAAVLGRVSEAINVQCLNRNEGSNFNLLFLIRFWFHLLSVKPDVIHCHNENAIRLMPFFKQKAVVTIHDIDWSVQHLRKYRKVFAISNAVAEYLKKFGIKSTVVHNGIMFQKYNRRTNYFIANTATIKLVQVSRLLHEKKGQDILLQALNIIVNKMNIRNISADIIGEGPSDSYLKQLTTDLQLNDHVHFTGNKDRSWIEQNLCNYHILVQPSRYEGFGLTVLEGIASGLPVIASEVDGPAEILAEMRSGFLFQNENSEQLAGKILSVIEIYKREGMEQLCSQSYLQAQEKYSLDTMVSSYLSNYN